MFEKRVLIRNSDIKLFHTQWSLKHCRTFSRSWMPLWFWSNCSKGQVFFFMATLPTKLGMAQHSPRWYALDEIISFVEEYAFIPVDTHYSQKSPLIRVKRSADPWIDWMLSNKPFSHHIRIERLSNLQVSQNPTSWYIRLIWTQERRIATLYFLNMCCEQRLNNFEII